jgi:hypothetical protein
VRNRRSLHTLHPTSFVTGGAASLRKILFHDATKITFNPCEKFRLNVECRGIHSNPLKGRLHTMSDPITIFPSNIFPSDYSVTGIRSEDPSNTVVIMTGNCKTKPVQGMIYRGSALPDNTSVCNWNSTNRTGCICVIPAIAGATSSILYGPDTPWFTSSIEKGNIRVVGSYKLNTAYDHGVMYEGPLTQDLAGLDDPKRWTKIDMQVEGKTVANTICHSTMGDLVVGNYDLNVVDGPDGKFAAFIYNIDSGEYFDLKTLLGLDSAKLITAYGIWQNNTDVDRHSTSYTIAGGIKDHSIGLNVGFLVDFNSADSTTSNPTHFPYQNRPALVTHFEGITQFGNLMTNYGPRYYSLAATGDKDAQNPGGAAFAIVERNPDTGSFVELAEWPPIQTPTASLTTGNTVLEKYLYGIYATGSGIQSYVAEISK